MAEEILSALFSMNLGKCAIDFKTEEVLLPKNSIFSQNYIPIISHTSTSVKSLSTKYADTATKVFIMGLILYDH